MSYTIPTAEQDQDDEDLKEQNELLREQNELLREQNEDLEAEVANLEARCTGLSRKFNNLVEVLFGDTDELGAYEPDEMRDILQRIVDVEDQVEDHENQVAMLRSGKGTSDTPDGRAKRLRQVLYNDAKKNSGKAAMDRDAVNSALGGGHHRGTVLDAMRRAANGREADISGSSKLPPLDGITFHAGSKRDEQSRIEMDLSDLTGTEVRQNLTTEDNDGGR